MLKITVTAPANIAFIKYWGRADHNLFLPLNNSISMTMSGCMTKTTCEIVESESDSVEVKFFGKEYIQMTPDSIKTRNIFDQIQRLREIAGSTMCVRIKTENNFPADAGIASSASGFAALTGALLLAYGLTEKFEDKQEFSRQVRLCGSGSAVRSVYGGFVEMLAGHDHNSSYAVQIAKENHWDLVDIVAVIEPGKKKISSSEGHEAAETSPFMNARVEDTNKRVPIVRKAILEKDFETLGMHIEKDSLSMHSVMMTQTPHAMYWRPGSISIMQDVCSWREDEHLLSYATFDAGANAHVICQKKDAPKVESKLKANPFVKSTIYNEPAPGVQQINTHLF
ncbi:diphosphomevalonate decarboxylase [Candidatus Woesebacteria bacterium]|nr:diphosphomevalonate decarboxylase [Candidatus Woesebacteria bacterium]